MRKLLHAMSIKNLLIASRNALLLGAIPLGASVYFLGRGPMFVDLAETRGRRVRQWVGSMRFRNSWCWRSAVRLIHPDVAIDVGANYGEIAFCAKYPPECKVVLIEANRRLAELLLRGAGCRVRRKENWRVLHAAASDYEGEADFFIDLTSSGTSRLHATSQLMSRSRVERVPVIRVGDISECRGAKRLVFKIDVEGTETGVLSGMRDLLDQADVFLGLVELSEKNLVDAGGSACELWNVARKVGRLALFDEEDQLVDCSDMSWADVVETAAARRLRFDYAADLVVYKGIQEINMLSAPRLVNRLAKAVKRMLPSALAGRR